MYLAKINVSHTCFKIAILTTALVLDGEVRYALSAGDKSRSRPRTMEPTALSSRIAGIPVESRTVTCIEACRLTIRQRICWSDSQSSECMCVWGWDPHGNARRHPSCRRNATVIFYTVVRRP